jgi:FtsH-binding integral membrane protein
VEFQPVIAATAKREASEMKRQIVVGALVMFCVAAAVLFLFSAPASAYGWAATATAAVLLTGWRGRRRDAQIQ